MKYIFNILIAIIFISCQGESEKQLIEDLRHISSNKFEGRKPGTEGSKKAKEYIIRRLEQIKVLPFKNSYVDSFSLKFINESTHGFNIQAIKKGQSNSDKIIVISAHYDHLGIKENQIYNGANDNATGVSVLINLISSLYKYQTKHSIIYLFLDAEEFGKQGVKHFLSQNAELHNKILLNFNIDMLNCTNEDELYLCGTKMHPKFKSILAEEVLDLKINFGHDGEDKEKKSWVNSSDHREFVNWDIPFLYFGSENEENYNTPNDNFENINLNCFSKTLDMTKRLVIELDKKLEE